VTQDYAMVDQYCPMKIQRGFNILNSWKSNKGHYPTLQGIFNLCNGVNSEADVDSLMDFAEGAFGNMA